MPGVGGMKGRAYCRVELLEKAMDRLVHKIAFRATSKIPNARIVGEHSLKSRA